MYTVRKKQKQNAFDIDLHFVTLNILMVGTKRGSKALLFEPAVFFKQKRGFLADKCHLLGYLLVWQSRGLSYDIFYVKLVAV